jgi:hypothetical protein
MAAVVGVAAPACKRGFPASKSPAKGEYLKTKKMQVANNVLKLVQHTLSKV